MKPFDLEAAMSGEPIVTRDGRKAKFVVHVPEAKNDQQVVLLVEGGLWYCGLDGHGFNDSLFMAPPPMRSINGHEYQEPVREPLEAGQRYWIAHILEDVLVPTEGLRWHGGRVDILWLKRGLIHLTREAAEAHARAIILAGGGEV